MRDIILVGGLCFGFFLAGWFVRSWISRPLQSYLLTDYHGRPITLEEMDRQMNYFPSDYYEPKGKL